MTCIFRFFTGNKTTYQYDAAGNIIKTTDPYNNVISGYTYNKNNKPDTRTTALCDVITYTYDSRNKLIKTVNSDGAQTTYEYDKAGRLVKTADALGRVTEYTYDPSGRILTETGPGGGITKYEYYLNGKVKSVTDPAGNTTRYEYDAAGRLVKEINPRGKAITYSYDENGNVTGITDAMGSTVTYEYNAINKKIKETDARGNSTIYTYNKNGLLESVTDALGNTTRYEYDCMNNLVKTTDARGNATEMEYDAKGRLIKITDALGYSVTMEYDANDNLVKKKDAYGTVIYSATYDEAGNILTETDALGSTVQNNYDRLSRLIEIIDQLGRSRKLDYDKLSRLTDVTDPLKGVSSQTFDLSGNIKTLTDPNGNTQDFEYDPAGRLIAETTAIGSRKTYGYNELNLLSEMTNGRGQVTNYEYDDNGRLISFTDAEGKVSYTYDANGNILTVTDSNGTVTREYDGLNRITKYTDYRGNVVEYSYDSVGNLIALTYPGGRIVRYEYDEVNNLVKVIDWNNRITEYEYDGNGRLVKTKRPNGTELTLIYDAAGQVVQRKEVDAEGNIIFQYDYVYDSAGNVIEENSDHEPLLHNLTGAVMEYGTGNILASYNGQQVEYDADGNMTYGPLNGQMAQYVFDARNRLISAGNTSYEYDAQNNRTAVIEDGNRTEYVINPNALLSQVLIRTDADGKQTFYIYGLGLIAQEDSEGNYSTYHYDSRGSTVAITDINGEVTDTFEYAPYGELVSRTGTTDTPFLFNGREGVMTDSNGLYYMRARYYNPEIKRFINQDVVQGTIENGLSLNRYAYSNGNPISYIDPFGLSPLDSEKTGGGIGQWFIDRWTDFKTGFETLTDLDKVKEAFELIDEYGTTSEKILAAYSAGFAYVFSAAAVVTTIYTGGYVINLAGMAIGSTTTGYFILTNAAPIVGSAFGLIGGGVGLIHHIKTEQYDQIPLDILMMVAGGIEAYYVYQGYSSYTSSINNPVVEGASKAAKGAGKGFDNFNALKKNLGPAGEGKAWHHVVEQSQIQKSGFSPQQIHNTNNVIAVDSATHAKISGYYNSIDASLSDTMRVRDWLAGQGFETQYQFGMDVLKRFGVTK